ncbi:mitochondrial ribonuclease P protein 1 homolog [Pogonomyrmex barbatus]|uniref:RNA (guanine-9-)-methyltransferase domain-containing protein 1 n=1 Tax=Pogonomyrmex barbatus TaxID=144034 RepID=A0A6I9WKC2_9HYME|nr:mitochondrial ribonuclease P protein 1 homolog [Pogonomyrmex barbatus]
MFNSVRRRLLISVGNFLVRSVHEEALSSSKLRFSAKAHLNNTYRRLYSQIAIKDQNVTSADLKNWNDKLNEEKLHAFLADPENNKRFQILELEVDVLRHNAEKVPNNITATDWLMLLDMKSKTKRKKYLDFLWTKETLKEKNKAKKELKKAEFARKKEMESEDTGEMKYGLLYNTLFMRIYESTINRFYNGKLIQNIMFEPKIVFDCGYDDYMNQREIHNCAKQISIAFADNRIHVNPLCLYLCNFNYNGLLKQYLHQNIPTLLNDDFPVVITSQSYLDIFPKNQLVYLTPHCRTELTEYDPDMTYIIGAYIDKADSQPLSLAKAKKEGICMAKFPIDKYLKWGSSSSKNLTINQSLKIMLDLRHTRDWNEALKNVPNRKLKSTRVLMLKRKVEKCLFQSSTQSKPNVLKDFTFQNKKKY